MTNAVRVTVTGAAGQIGYALLFRIASGAMLGEDQPVILQLLDIAPAMDALEGVKMEIVTMHCWSVPDPAAQAWSARTYWKLMLPFSQFRVRPSTTTPAKT